MYEEYENFKQIVYYWIEMFWKANKTQGIEKFCRILEDQKSGYDMKF